MEDPKDIINTILAKHAAIPVGVMRLQKQTHNSKISRHVIYKNEGKCAVRQNPRDVNGFDMSTNTLTQCSMQTGTL